MNSIVISYNKLCVGLFKPNLLIYAPNPFLFFQPDNWINVPDVQNYYYYFSFVKNTHLVPI